jgi:uncharacterized protein YdaU (DUF1376 family)
MSSTPPMPLDTDAYLADTPHLSTVEHGAYMLILMTLWRSKDGWIDGNEKYLRRVARLSPAKWRQIEVSIRKLLIEKDGKVAQKRSLKTHWCRIPVRDSDLGSKPLKNNKPTPKIQENGQNGHSYLPSLTLSSELEPQKEKKKTRGEILPGEWKPRDQERLYGRTVRHLSETEINAAAEKMKRWALANAHRAVAKKSDWDVTFRNWLDRDADAKAERINPSEPPDGRL